MKPYTEEEKKQILKKISDLVASGVMQKDAIKRTGISYATFWKWGQSLGCQVPRSDLSEDFLAPSLK